MALQNIYPTCPQIFVCSKFQSSILVIGIHHKVMTLLNYDFNALVVVGIPIAV